MRGLPDSVFIWLPRFCMHNFSKNSGALHSISLFKQQITCDYIVKFFLTNSTSTLNYELMGMMAISKLYI